MKYQKKTHGPAEKKVFAAASGQWAQAVPPDRSKSAIRSSYTPERLGSIFAAADSGDIEALCLLSRDILERNWDVIGAMDQRAEALCGVPFEVLPGGDSEADKRAAENFKKALSDCGELNGLDTFYELIKGLTEAVIAPFAASEIIWEPGGGLAGFQSVEPWHFTLRESFEPLLICDEYPSGMPLPDFKFVIHRFRKCPDLARSGRIRTIAWLHCFQNWPMKDLFSFVERFGMPFVVAKVDKQTWDEERDTLHRLIKSFGPSGGGVFTQGTELQLLNAANTGSDNIYFRILDYTREAIYRLLLGQTASSSDGGGLSSDNAQSEVRQDILESDARSIESTIRSQIAAPWTAYHDPSAATPKLHFPVEPPEDTAAFATLVQTLYNSGFESDPQEIGEKVGLKLTKREMPAAPSNAMEFSADNKKDPSAGLSGALEAWLGPFGKSVSEMATLSDEEFDRACREHREPERGDSEMLENLMTSEMIRIKDQRSKIKDER